MNLANKITYLRLLLIPVFISIFYLGSKGVIISSFIFIVAALTDFFDGYIARKTNKVTILGSFLDPLVDKILIMAAFVLLVTIELIPVWSIILILAREFMINGLRFIAAEKKIIISASFLGKVKTISQMVSIIFLLLSPLNAAIFLIGIIIYWIAVVATIISGVEYIYQYRELLK